MWIVPNNDNIFPKKHIPKNEISSYYQIICEYVQIADDWDMLSQIIKHEAPANFIVIDNTLYRRK